LDIVGVTVNGSGAHGTERRHMRMGTSRVLVCKCRGNRVKPLVVWTT
jgi:hypothetical protein